MTGTDGHSCNWRLPPAVKAELADIADESARGWLTGAMREYAKGELSPTKVKPVGDGILELTIDRGGVFLRCLFFHPMPFIAVGLKIFMKKTNKLPKQEHRTAQARKSAWERGGGA